MLGNGTGNVAVTTAGAANTVFIGNGASSDPTFSATPTISGALTTLQTLGTVSTDGLVLQNTTAAAAGAQQYSPRLHFQGQGWKTTATAASQAVDFIAEVQPVQGSTAPTGNLVLSSNIGTAGYNPLMTVTSAGNVGIGFTFPFSPTRTTPIPTAAKAAKETSGRRSKRNQKPDSYNGTHPAASVFGYLFAVAYA
jgi:hypothetical protein